MNCGVEAVPSLWTTGAAEGFVLLAAQEVDHTLEPGDVVAQVRSGLVETAACDCGAVETSLVGEEGPCETCGVSKAPDRGFRRLLLLWLGRSGRSEKLPDM